MKAAEFRENTIDQLREQLVELKKEQFNLRFQQAHGALQNPSRIKAVRRQTARLKTVLNEKVRAASD